MLKLIDTHCHPQLGAYNDDRAEVMRRTLERGIGMVVVGTTLADSQSAISLAADYQGQPVWAAVGVHPTDEELSNLDLSALKPLATQPRVVAIGETGLDYFHVDDPHEQDLQADYFEQQILIAQEARLPLIVHCRDVKNSMAAYDNVLTLLRRHSVSRFVMHCYSGDWAHAERYLELGGYLSFTGIITFPKSDVMQDVLRRTPADRLMVETDAPFLAPEPYRGKRCEPAYVEYVARKAAELRGVNLDDLIHITTDNAQQFFGLSAE